MASAIEHKLEELKARLRELDSVVVAFSGGFDSGFLLKVATDVLGERAVGVTAVSDSLPERERRDAVRIAEKYGARHLLVTSKEIENPDYAKNEKNRCFYCKTALFGLASEIKGKLGFANVVDGATMDDLDDFRPGREAARQAGVRSPFIEAGLCKDELRELARKMDLDFWDKPASACLSSRIPYGIEITQERLKRVERFEDALKKLGFRQLRVRFHEQVARIEVAETEMNAVLEQRIAINQAGREAGFTFVTLDLAGYRTGSLNQMVKG